MPPFDHPDIQVLAFDDIPLDRDIYLMGAKWMTECDADWMQGVSGGEWGNPGYVTYAAARHIHDNHIELSWYPNITDRFHEMVITLPRSAFVTAIDIPKWDFHPTIFVNDNWHNDLYLRSNSAFALVDAIGVKNALASGAIAGTQLDALRDRLDAIAAADPSIALVSFADSLLVKANWSVGMVDSDVEYTYRPESLLRALPAIAQAYADTLGLSSYAVVTQGRNEFYRDELIHVSPEGHHVSLNSLGMPFAQLQSIEQAARQAIKEGRHGPESLYLDARFFHSLKWADEFAKGGYAKYPFPGIMTTAQGNYVCLDLHKAVASLKLSSR